VQIGFVIFPNVTQLDFTGPLQVMHRIPGATTHILARSLEAVPSDCGLGLLPTASFAAAPKLDLICVPGGFGVADALEDRETLSFVRSAAGQARYVTSVCTGAFVLGAAGLLRGKRATTHWAYRHLLARVGAVPETARVVRDGHVITGGGVTAGLDFAFTIAAEVAGEEAARRIQLALEYDPKPAFDAGDPERAPHETRAHVESFYTQRTADFAQRLRAFTIA
jgi:cyclohexyl-isocyanide hydratase